MRKEHDSIVHLNNAVLQKLKNDPNSCVEVKSCQHHLILHPFHLINISDSIKEILNSGIAKYHKEFKAILLGYQNVKMLGYKAPMSDDTVFMHTHIEADFYLFKPSVGSELHGIINKKSQDHVGCLVHQLFNISLPKPKDLDDWLGYNAKLGQEIKFRITYIVLDARLPYIRGEIIAILNEDSGISTSDETTVPKNKAKKFSEDSGNEMEFNDEEVIIKTCKKKKSKEKKHISNDLGEIDETDSVKTKKHKKKKVRDEELENNEIEMIETTDTHKKKKSKKKSKDNTEEQIITESTKESHKKKKKSKDKDKTQAVEEPQQEIQTNPEEISTKKKKSKKGKKQENNEDLNGNIEKEDLIKQLKDAYQSTLSRLKEITENEEENKTKHKKEKKKKSKIKQETNILDQTLPDLNLEQLFEGRCSQSPINPSMDTSDIVKHLELPSDSEMEAVLKDVTSGKKSSKKSKRKRESVGDEGVDCDDVVQTPKKKKKKRDSI